METSKTSESDRGIYRVGDHDKRTNRHSAYEISRVIDALHAASSAGNRFECHHFYFCLWKQHEKCTARDCFFHGVYNHDYCIFFFWQRIVVGPSESKTKSSSATPDSKANRVVVTKASSGGKPSNRVVIGSLPENITPSRLKELLQGIGPIQVSEETV